MTREEFIQGITIINSVCQKQIEVEATLNVYFLTLKDLNFKDYMEAIIELIKEKEFLHSPLSPAEIRNKVKSMKKTNLIASNILDKLRIDIIKYGAHNKPEYPLDIEMALESIGGWGKLCATEDDKFYYIEKEFIKNYNENCLAIESKDLKKIN